jgi:hypothetical protein
MKKEIWEKEDALLRTVDSFFEYQFDTARLVNEQILWRNLLYYIGEQYIEYLRSTKSFRRRIVPDNVPTPVSNDIREHVRSVKSMLMNQKMVPRVWPNTNEKEDIQAADLGESLLSWMDNANDASFFDEKEKNCIWLCLSGTSFMRTFPDADGGMWLPEGGKTGDVACECVLPFNVRLDTMGDSLQKKRWIGIQSLKDKEWVEDTFKVKLNNETKSYLDYARTLSKLVSNVSPWKGQSISTQNLEQEEDLVLFKEVEFAPQRDFPEGRYVVSCGGKLLQVAERLPIQTIDGVWNYSLTDFHYNYVPGRFWSDAPVSDLISPQNTINEIDQSLAVNRKGVGKPTLFVAGDVGLKRIDVGNIGFNALSYNPIMGQKPTMEQGTPLPAQVLEERSIQKAQFQDSSGDPKNILKGQQPSANASGVMTDVLRETAEQGKYPDVERWNRSLTRVYKKRLILAQELFTEERLIKIAGRGNKVKITKFKGADLRGNTDVRLELDSGLIKTRSGQAQMLLNMIQAGFFQDQGVSPTVRQEVLTRMGMTSFSDETNNDVDRAEAENESVASGEQTVMLAEPDLETGEDVVLVNDPMFKYDNHADHYEAHRKYIISPEIKELDPRFQTVLIAHTDLHQKMLDDAPPDIRDYIQIDKLLLPGVLTVSERAQILTKYLGIEPGEETEAGIPTADVVLKSKEKLMQTELKEPGKREQMMVNAELKAKQMSMDMVKHAMTEGNKERAINSKPKTSGTGK